MEQVTEQTEACLEAADPPQGASVRVTPLHMNVRDDFNDAPVSFVRRGVQVDVITPDGRIPYSKEVWQRGVYLPFRPFYEQRIEHAKNRAAKIAGALAVAAS